MKIYKLFVNTADDYARREFGEHYFVGISRALEERDRVMREFVKEWTERLADHPHGRPDYEADGTRVRVTMKVKDGLKETLRSPWYQIDEITTED